jgi:rhodanese-related sulfurtransferase
MPVQAGKKMKTLFAGATAFMLLTAAPAPTQTIFDTTLGEADQKTAEISTKELKAALMRGDAVVLDARPPMEFAVSHIPGALNVAPQPGRPVHLYISDVAEVERLLGPVKDKAIILYCNGPFCGKTKRLGAELVAAGRTNIRRYQLGAPSWRALSGEAMQTELAALKYIDSDKTAVWIDAREEIAFKSGSLTGARNVAPSGLRPGKDQGVMKQAKDDGRLPMNDHNTRIIVFGANPADVRAVANAIAGEAFHNVSFVAEPIDKVLAALASR